MEWQITPPFAVVKARTPPGASGRLGWQPQYKKYKELAKATVRWLTETRKQALPQFLHIGLASQP